MRIGVLHPGEMGAAVGAALVGAGHDVRWASTGRSEATRLRAAVEALGDAGTVDALAAWAELVVSVCPPHAALDVASGLGPFAGTYLDANAVSPTTTRETCRVIVAGGGRFVDGAIVGPPPRRSGTTRLYLSGPDAVAASEAFATPLIETQVISGWPGAASALKLSYSAWTKGSAALLLAVRALAAAEGVEQWLLDEWRTSQPDLAERSTLAARQALAKGWRWDGEMLEVARAFEDHAIPDGFATAAAAVFRRVPHDDGPDAVGGLVDAVVAALLHRPAAPDEAPG